MKKIFINLIVLLALSTTWNIVYGYREFKPNTGFTAYVDANHSRIYNYGGENQDIRYDITYKGSDGDNVDSCMANFGDINKIVIVMQGKYDNQPVGDSQHFYYDIWLATGPFYLKEGHNLYANRTGDFYALGNMGMGDWYADEAIVFDSLPPGRYSFKVDLYDLHNLTQHAQSDLEIKSVKIYSDGDEIDGTADTLSPNGVGTVTNYDIVDASCNDNYECVDDPAGAMDGGTTELEMDYGQGTPETYLMEDFNASHPGCDVWRIEVESRANDEYEEENQYRNAIAFGATRETSPQHTPEATYKTGFKDLLYYPSNPDSGIWTPGDIDSLELGFLSYVGLFDDGIQFSQIYGIVTYGSSYGGPVVKDAYVDEDNATTNYDATTLKINGTAGHKKYTYLHFDLNGIGKPTDVGMSDDSIYLRQCSLSLVRKSPSEAVVLYLAPLATAFVEDQATWTVYSTGNSWTTGGGDFDSCSEDWCDTLSYSGAASGDADIAWLVGDTTVGLLKLIHDSLNSDLHLILATEYEGDVEIYSSEYENTDWRPTLYLRWGILGQSYIETYVRPDIVQEIHGPHRVSVVHSKKGTSPVHSGY